MNRKNLTPQGKKKLSYLKDCRNMIAESRSLSRIAVAKKRADSHQAFRTAQKQIVNELLKSDNNDFDVLENRERIQKIKGWRKISDSPLGEFVSVLLNRRKKYGINKTLKISRILRSAERKRTVEWRSTRWEIPKKLFE